MANYHFLLALVLIGCLYSGVVEGNYTTEAYDALTTSLFTNYTNTTRPSQVVAINVDFQFITIQNVDVKNGIFAASGWWIITWEDSRLTWKSADHNDIPAVVVYESAVWTPALVVSNSNEDLSAIDDDTIPLRVTEAGSLLWRPPAILNVNCDFDITDYPFDEQTCYIELTSFGYTIQEINLTSSGGVQTGYYSTDGEWSLESVGVGREEYEDAGLDYARIFFSVKISRKSTYYGLNVIFPVIVTGILTIFVFQVPPDCGEKLGYALTILLTFVVLMTLVAEAMPSTSNFTPLLEIYIAVTLALSAFSVLLSILVLDLFHKEDSEPVPGWLQTFTLSCQRIICKRKSVHKVQTAPRLPGESSPPPERLSPFSKFSNNKQAGGGGKAHDRPSSSRSDEVNDEVTWRLVANNIDSVMMRLYVVLFVALTMGFILAIAA